MKNQQLLSNKIYMYTLPPGCVEIHLKMTKLWRFTKTTPNFCITLHHSTQTSAETTSAVARTLMGHACSHATGGNGVNVVGKAKMHW